MDRSDPAAAQASEAQEPAHYQIQLTLRVSRTLPAERVGRSPWCGHRANERPLPIRLPQQDQTPSPLGRSTQRAPRGHPSKNRRRPTSRFHHARRCTRQHPVRKSKPQPHRLRGRRFLQQNYPLAEPPPDSFARRSSTTARHARTSRSARSLCCGLGVGSRLTSSFVTVSRPARLSR